MIDESLSSHRSGDAAELALRPSRLPDFPADPPLWTADEVRAAVASAIARGQSWIAAWGVSWLAERGHEVDGASLTWLIARAPAAALVEMFERIGDGARLRAQLAIAQAISAGLPSLEDRDADAANIAALALACHLGRLDAIDDDLIAFIEVLPEPSIAIFIPALARCRDPRAPALLLRLLESDLDTEILLDALIALVRRGDTEAVASAAPALLATDPETIYGSIPYELTMSMENLLDLLPLRERILPFLHGADDSGAITARDAVANLTEGCDADTARRLGEALPPRAAERVHRSLLSGRPAAAWKLLIPGAARAAELAAAESPRFAAEARAIGALVAALAESGFPEEAPEEEQDGLCESLVLLIAHLARAHRVDDELAEPTVGSEEARALLLVDLPWVEDTTIARARALLSPAKIDELAARRSGFARRNALILRALADPDGTIGSLVHAGASRNSEPPLAPALEACTGHFGPDALPALARAYGELPTDGLARALHRTAARLGTERARGALRAFPESGTIPQESFAPMVLLAMDLRDVERAREVIASLGADPSERLLVVAESGEVPEGEEIRAALAEMLEITGGGGEVDEAALAAIADRTHAELSTMRESARLDAPDDGFDALEEMELDEIAADDELWGASDPDSAVEDAMRRLAAERHPEPSFRERLREPLPRGGTALDRLGAHDDSCGPGCGHSHAAPVRPLHAAAKVGRNDPCPCGSGRKFKRCCGSE